MNFSKIKRADWFKLRTFCELNFQSETLGTKMKLSDRMSALNENAKNWKPKNKSEDHSLLTGYHYALSLIFH